MPQVRYVGGSMDGQVMSAPPEYADHPQRELHGNDMDRPYELYRRGEADRGGAQLFEFVSASATRVLDDDQNPIDATGTAK